MISLYKHIIAFMLLHAIGTCISETIVVGDRKFVSHDKITVLTPDTVPQWLLTGEKRIILYYAPWCSWSRVAIGRLYKWIDQFIDQYGDRLLYGTIDCHQYRATCMEHKVPRFPTARLFSGGSFVEFPIATGVDAFPAWLERTMDKERSIKDMNAMVDMCLLDKYDTLLAIGHFPDSELGDGVVTRVRKGGQETVKSIAIKLVYNELSYMVYWDTVIFGSVHSDIRQFLADNVYDMNNKNISQLLKEKNIDVNKAWMILISPNNSVPIWNLSTGDKQFINVFKDKDTKGPVTYNVCRKDKVVFNNAEIFVFEDMGHMVKQSINEIDYDLISNTNSDSVQNAIIKPELLVPMFKLFVGQVLKMSRKHLQYYSPQLVSTLLEEGKPVVFLFIPGDGYNIYYALYEILKLSRPKERNASYTNIVEDAESILRTRIYKDSKLDVKKEILYIYALYASLASKHSDTHSFVVAGTSQPFEHLMLKKFAVEKYAWDHKIVPYDYKLVKKSDSRINILYSYYKYLMKGIIPGMPIIRMLNTERRAPLNNDIIKYRGSNNDNTYIRQLSIVNGILVNSERYDDYFLDGEFDEQSITKWMDDIKSHKLSPYLISEPKGHATSYILASLKELYPSETLETVDISTLDKVMDMRKLSISSYKTYKEYNINIITSATYVEDLLISTDYVFVMIHTPWCGHCHKAMPLLYQLAGAFKNCTGLKIAILNGTLNQIPVMNVDSYPTFLLFSPNRHLTPLVHDGERTLRSLVQFIYNMTEENIVDKKTGELFKVDDIVSLGEMNGGIAKPVEL